MIKITFFFLFLFLCLCLSFCLSISLYFSLPLLPPPSFSPSPSLSLSLSPSPFFSLNSFSKIVDSFEGLLGPLPPTRLIMATDNKLRKQIQEQGTKYQKVYHLCQYIQAVDLHVYINIIIVCTCVYTWYYSYYCVILSMMNLYFCLIS